MLHRRWYSARLTAGLALLVALGLHAGPARAQGSVRAWGMGGACTAAARGLDAAAWNPANLALDGGLDVGLVSAGVDLHNNAFTLDRYNEISGATLDQADKDRILADIPAEGLRLDADLRASALGIRRGPLALTVQGLAGGGGRIDRDFFSLVLLGNEVGESVSFADTRGEAYAVGAATLSAAAPLATGFHSRLLAGINLRYLRGLYETHVEDAAGELVTSLDGIRGAAHASVLSAEGGRGYGVDLGLALQAPRGWLLGLALDNLVSSVTWDVSPERRIRSVSADTVSLTHEDLDAAVSDRDTSFAAAPYATRLPRRLRLGASNRLGDLLVALDLSQGLENRAGVSTRTAVSAGLEWQRLAWLHPRCGASLGGAGGSRLALGLGLRLGPWRLDLAATNRGSLWPADTKGLGLAAGSSLKF